MSIEQAVLQGRLDNFENFKTNYIAAIDEMIAALKRLENAQKEAETPMTGLERTEIAVKDALSAGIDKITSIANAVKKAGESASSKTTSSSGNLSKSEVKSKYSSATPVKPKAAGSHSLPSTDLYRINELGDELLIPPTGNLAYLTKGTGVVPAHLTSNLMDLGQYNMAQWAKLIGSANGVGSVDSHNVIIQNMTVQSNNANDFVRQLQNLAILKK